MNVYRRGWVFFNRLREEACGYGSSPREPMKKD